MENEKFLLLIIRELKQILGSIKLQKIVYFVQQFESKYYNYYMYNFGPYSDQLSYDLKKLEFIGAIEINHFAPYSYKYNEKIGEILLKDTEEFNSTLKEKIKYLGNLDSTLLESMATVHLIFLDYLHLKEINEIDKYWEDILKTFLRYKGNRFNKGQIEISRDELKELLS